MAKRMLQYIEATGCRAASASVARHPQDITSCVDLDIELLWWITQFHAGEVQTRKMNPSSAIKTMTKFNAMRLQKISTIRIIKRVNRNTNQFNPRNKISNSYRTNKQILTTSLLNYAKKLQL